MGQFEEGVKLVVGHNFDNNRKQPRLSIKKMVSGKHDKCSEDLIYIENMLHSYAEIVWRREDIARGYIIYRKTKYYLLDVMKTETPVLEYIYHYKDSEFCLIDVGMVDYKYKKGDLQTMYKYYNKDWYKILKSYRWKLQEQYKEEYFAIMKNIEVKIAVEYQIELLQKSEKYNLLSPRYIQNIKNEINKQLLAMDLWSGMDYSDLQRELKSQINDYLSKYIDHFKTKLLPKHQVEAEILFNRGLDANIPVDLVTLQARSNKGVKCPFFSMDIEEYKYLTQLANRIFMNPKKLTDCISKVADNTQKTVKNITSVMGRNPLYLVKKDNILILKNDTKILGTYLQGDLEKLQAYILLSA